MQTVALIGVLGGSGSTVQPGNKVIGCVCVEGWLEEVIGFVCVKECWCWWEEGC